jgi:hypothetical protein
VENVKNLMKQLNTEKQTRLQNSGNEILNWFLQTKSSCLDGEPEHTLHMIARNIGTAYQNFSSSRFQTIRVNKSISALDLALYNDEDKAYLQPLAGLQQQAVKNLEGFVSHFFVHGSLATRDYIKGWSDVDALVVVNKETIDDPAELTKLRKLCLPAHQYLIGIDPLQHHGLQFITDYDLKAYPSTFLPPGVLNNAVSLSGPDTITLNTRDSGAEQIQSFIGICETLKQACEDDELRHHPYHGEYLLGKYRNAGNGMYQLKYLLSVVMLLPSYFLGLIGTETTKKDSFDLCQPLISDSAWSIIEKASGIRSLWAEKENFPYKGNAIPGWVKDILGEEYLYEAYSLAREMRVKYEEYTANPHTS